MRLLLILTLLQIPSISVYLKFKEATQTNVTVGCSPNASAVTATQLRLMQQFGVGYFDPLRVRVGSPLYVSSLFRSQCINAKVGGAKKSEHMILTNVVACDIDQDGRGKVGNRALFFLIKDGQPFRQLIWEFGTTTSPNWCHVSWSPDPTKNIGKIYRSTRLNNRVIYQNFNPYQ